MIGIASIGIGTTKTIQNMLNYIGVNSNIATDSSNLEAYSHIILPGVGNFSEGSRQLNKNGWRDSLISFADTRPLLGICLGMQLLGKSSDEGPGEGLGLLDFNVEEIPSYSALSSIHMGWNTVTWKDDQRKFEDERFYFTHGYCVRGIHEFTSGTTTYGEPFTSALHFNKIWGFQFHPEKSHKFGMRLLKEFSELS